MRECQQLFIPDAFDVIFLQLERDNDYITATIEPLYAGYRLAAICYFGDSHFVARLFRQDGIYVYDGNKVPAVRKERGLALRLDQCVDKSVRYDAVQPSMFESEFLSFVSFGVRLFVLFASSFIC